MKIELNRSKIDEEIMNFLQEQYSIEDYNKTEKDFEIEFNFQSKYRIIVPFRVWHSLISYKNCWVYAEIIKSKVEIDVKVISRNPNPNIESLQDRFDEFIEEFERDNGLDEHKYREL